MNRLDTVWLTGLALAAIWIWCRDLGWIHQASSTFPILFSLAWYAWLVSPWQVVDQTSSVSKPQLAVAAVLVFAGVGTNLTVLLAVAWSISFRAWIATRFDLATRYKANRLLLLIVMAFPWMTLDGEFVSTFFRLTAAQFSASFFTLVGFSVERAGTNLWIQGLPVSVNEACSGLGALQAVMIAGLVLLEALVPQNNRFWMQIPLLAVAAWTANALRVIVISIAALTWGTDFAAGSFHTWGGMGILLIVFCFAWGIIQLQQKAQKQ